MTSAAAKIAPQTTTRLRCPSDAAATCSMILSMGPGVNATGRFVWTWFLGRCSRCEGGGAEQRRPRRPAHADRSFPGTCKATSQQTRQTRPDDTKADVEPGRSNAPATRDRKGRRAVETAVLRTERTRRSQDLP